MQEIEINLKLATTLDTDSFQRERTFFEHHLFSDLAGSLNLDCTALISCFTQSLIGNLLGYYWNLDLDYFHLNQEIQNPLGSFGYWGYYFHNRGLLTQAHLNSYHLDPYHSIQDLLTQDLLSQDLLSQDHLSQLLLNQDHLSQDHLSQDHLSQDLLDLVLQSQERQIQVDLHRFDYYLALTKALHLTDCIDFYL